MATGVSNNRIPDLNEDWSRDTRNNLPYSGERVQQFIKENLGAIARAAYFDSGVSVLYYFGSEEDMQEFVSDPSKIELPLYSTNIRFDSVLYNIVIRNNNDSTSINVATNTDVLNLSVDFELQTKSIADQTWNPTGEGVSVNVFVDAGATGNYVPFEGQYQTRLNADEQFNLNVRRALIEGANRVKIVFTGEEHQSTVSSITYNINVMALYVEIHPNNTWYRAIVEGGADANYRLGGFVIAGALDKTLVVQIWRNIENQEPEKSFEIYLGNETYDQWYLNRNTDASFDLSSLDTGVYKLVAYLTSGDIRSNAVSYNFMYVSFADIETAQLVCMNNVAKFIYNYTTPLFFNYAVYNQNRSQGSPTVTLKGRIGQNEDTLVNKQYTVETGKKHECREYISWIPSSDVELKLNAEISYGDIIQSDDIPVDNSLSFPPISNYDFYLNAETRNNADENREEIVNLRKKTSVQQTDYETYTPVWENMIFVDNSDGWTSLTSDERKGLLIPAKSKMTLSNEDFAFLSNGQYGFTFEICYKVFNVADYDETVISVAENVNTPGFTGIRIKPTNITVHSTDNNDSDNDVRQGVNVMDEEVVHFIFTVNPNYENLSENNKLLTIATGYINGCRNFEFSYNRANWVPSGSNPNFPLVIGANKSDVVVYFIRRYDFSFSDQQAVTNYISSLEDPLNRRSLYNELYSVVNANSPHLAVDYTFVKNNNYNYFVVEMAGASTGKSRVPSAANGWEKERSSSSTLEMHYGENPSWDWKMQDVETSGQGTTSMGYYRWNIRWRIDSSNDSEEVPIQYLNSRSIIGGSYTYNWYEAQNRKVVMFDGQNRHPGVKRITAKINFASSMQSHKIGATRAYEKLHSDLELYNEAQIYAKENNKPVPTVAVYEYPAFGFEKIGNEYLFIGLFTIGPDKGDKPTFGYDINSDIKNSLITLEGSDHNQNVVMFNYPWDNNMTYSSSEQYLNHSAVFDRGGGGWEVSNCCGLKVKDVNKESEVLEVLVSEFKDAYDVAFKNSTLIIGIEKTDNKTAEQMVEDINNDIDDFIEQTVDNGRGLQKLAYQFWIEDDYNLYYYNKEENKFLSAGVDLNEDFPSVALDPNFDTVEKKNEEYKRLRKERFRENAEGYWDMQDAFFHYAFLIIIGAIDNFGKNTYPYLMKSISEGGRWKWRQDDLDSILGINNSGVDIVPFDSEYSDLYNSGGIIYNGSSSLFWNLIHEACMEDYTVGGQTRTGVRTMGKEILNIIGNTGGTGNAVDGSMSFFKTYFWDYAQEYFPVTAYNYDARFKYDAAYSYGYEGQAPALPQSLGNHYSAERYWTYNRIIYLLSYFRVGPFDSYSASVLGVIPFRLMSGTYSIGLKYSKRLYPSLSMGQSTLYGDRTNAGDTYTFEVKTLESNTTYYFLATHTLKEITGFSNLYINTDDTPNPPITGKKMERFDASKSNVNDGGLNISGIGFPNNPCLEYINLENVSSLRETLDLSHCTRLQEGYFKNTNFSEIILADGQRIKHIEYPDSITRFVMRNVRMLSDDHLILPQNLEMLTTVYVINCSIDSIDLLYRAYNTEDSRLKYFKINIPDDIILESSASRLHFINNLATDKDRNDEFRQGRYKGVDDNGSGNESLNPILEGTIYLKGAHYEADESGIDPNTIQQITYDNKQLSIGRMQNLGTFVIYDPTIHYFVFEDKNVQKALAREVSEDGEGFMEEDLPNITDIQDSFVNNTDIVSFKEFKLFTGVTSLSDTGEGGKFEGCTSLEILHLPENITSFGNNCFKDCTSLSNITGWFMNPPAVSNTFFQDLPNNGVLFTFPGALDLYDAAWMKEGTTGYLADKGWSITENYPTDGKVYITYTITNVSSATTILGNTSGVETIELYDGMAWAPISVATTYPFSSTGNYVLRFKLTSYVQNRFSTAAMANVSKVCVNDDNFYLHNSGNSSTLILNTIVLGPDMLKNRAFGGYLTNGLLSLQHLFLFDLEAYLSWPATTNGTFFQSSSSTGHHIYIKGIEITELVVPSGVTSIPIYAFNYCTSITSATMPSSVTSIGQSAFMYCTSLATFTYQGTTAQWGNVRLETNWKLNAPFTVVHCSDGNVTL